MATYSDWQQRQMDAASGAELDRIASRRLHPMFQEILEKHGAPKPLDRTCGMCGARRGFPCSVNCPENNEHP